ncbi:hypothetical protein AMQ84_24395 [Paenibacillus riograndensis]|uniref:Uncharacterized protein n=1 Tax=Paenibacillus riograndensis TaxID=483937 RepID=A0A132TP26_9BACL|nr:hypothetical protein [Paenibacillus riograndensis]KWX73040.1 hypothetical protein AMQ84_24395 [Paenibacillus riograndensis]
MKKAILLGTTAVLLLATPVSAFASSVSSPARQEVQKVELTAASKYITDYKVETYYRAASSIPQTYRHTFTDSNGVYWSGSLSLSRVVSWGDLWFGVYSGYVYVVEQS